MADHRKRYEKLLGNRLQDKYLLNGILGEGGMGVVFEAENVLIRRKVAVKILNPDLKSDEEVVERFHREAQAAAYIGHKNIVDILDLGFTDDHTPFIVMEYLKGESLLDIRNRKGMLEDRETLEIVFQILSALVAAHAKGVIHRDLKPENVFISYSPSGDAEAKILDFGISKFAHGTGSEITSPGLTKVGTVMGTPYYMSPEQARGDEDIDARTDIYSAGVLLYELLTGHLPYEEENYNMLMARLLTEDPPPPRSYRPDITVDLEKVILKAMSRDRNERYSRMVELLSDLMPFFKGEKESLVERKISVIPPPSEEEELKPEDVPTVKPFPESAQDSGSDTGEQPVFMIDGMPAKPEDVLPVPTKPHARTLTPTGWSDSAARRRKMTWGGIVGGAAVIVALMLMFLGGGEEMTDSATEGPGAGARIEKTAGDTTLSQETSGPVKTQSLMKVEMNPADAVLSVNGETRDESEFRLDNGSGPYTLKALREGYEPFSQTVPVIDRDMVIKIDLKKMAARDSKTGKDSGGPDTASTVRKNASGKGTSSEKPPVKRRKKNRFKRDNPFE